MITCNLQGGLGNQMFQIAATYALALRNNDEAGFDFKSCHTPLQGNPSIKYKNTILRNVKDIDNTPRVSYTEPRFGYEELPYAPNLGLNGYFQSEKYFIDYKNNVLSLFNISNRELADEFLYHYDVMFAKPLTSVHVRRGDYLNNPDFHPVCTIEYYRKAMDIIGDSVFVFISDDMDWVKENFKGDNIVYSNNDELTDFAIMTLTEHNIIANSSFSWWGAYMNQFENPRTMKFSDKKIIAPKQWFGPKGPQDTQDIIPKNWIKI